MKERKPHILIIDDEKNVTEMIREMLSTKGYEASCVDDGKLGLDIVRQNNIELVITDLKMPGMDGLDVLREIKRFDPTIEVVLITAFASVETALQCMKEGAYDYISKPLDLGKLAFLVERALKKRELETMVEFYKTSKSVFSSMAFDTLLNTIVTVTSEVLKADEASVMLFDNERRLYIAASSGISDEIVRATRLKLCDGVAGRVAHEKGSNILSISSGFIGGPSFVKVT